jgi:hypothetical protein
MSGDSKLGTEIYFVDICADVTSYINCKLQFCVAYVYILDLFVSNMKSHL